MDQCEQLEESCRESIIKYGNKHIQNKINY
jgi:hypothetical protein